MAQNPRKIVVIGGGTGTYTVLSALRKYNTDLSAVVSMCDDGGSTGRLRDDYGVLPPGDIRRSLIALSSADDELRKLFEFRFAKGVFKGHNFGNIFLAGLEQSSGSFYNAVKTAASILNVQGNVYPVTLDNVRLHAELEDGGVVSGETNIDIPKHNPDLRIRKIFLKPKAKANRDAIKAILEADAIVVGPGDLYTSILPNFLVSGVVNAFNKSKAKKIYICNLMTKYGETNNYTLKDFINAIEKYIGPKSFNYLLVNNKKPSQTRLKKYIRQKAELVAISNFSHQSLVIKDLVTDQGLIRHDQKKLGETLIKLCRQ